MNKILSEPWITILIIAVMLWTIPWKGVALWKSAKRGQLGWFIALLIINSLAILDILYIFIFSKMGMEKKADVEMPRRVSPNLGNRKNIV